jgi:hypothetical protein
VCGHIGGNAPVGFHGRGMASGKTAAVLSLLVLSCVGQLASTISLGSGP